MIRKSSESGRAWSGQSQSAGYDAAATGVPAAEVRSSQEVLEVGEHGSAPVQVTQEILEVAERLINSNYIGITQEALEIVERPTSEQIRTSQIVLEVVYKPITVYPSGAGKIIPQYVRRRNLF